jgi:hypothetical protein
MNLPTGFEGESAEEKDIVVNCCLDELALDGVEGRHGEELEEKLMFNLFLSAS